MRRIVAAIVVAVTALSLAGCGIKGPLKPPPTATGAPEARPPPTPVEPPASTLPPT